MISSDISILRNNHNFGVKNFGVAPNNMAFFIFVRMCLYSFGHHFPAPYNSSPNMFFCR